MKKKLLLATLGLSVSSILVGCGVSPIALNDYGREVSLPHATHMPTKADLQNQGRAKVVVFEASDGNVAQARESQAANALTREIESVLGENGVEIIDRSLASRLDKELKLAEMQGVSSSSDGPAVAGFAIKSSINNTEYSKSYNEARSWTDKKGKSHHVPASWSHSAKASISLRVYEIPSLRLLKTVNGSGSSSNSTSDNAGNEHIKALIRKATQDSVNDAKAAFLNLFAPKGYILGKRSNGKQSILRTSIGSNHGLVQGANVVIYSERESTHPITQKVSYESMPVVEGTVSNLVKPDEAWIIPKDEAQANNVHLGDTIQVEHKDGGLVSLKRSIKNLGM